MSKTKPLSRRRLNEILTDTEKKTPVGNYSDDDVYRLACEVAESRAARLMSKALSDEPPPSERVAALLAKAPLTADGVPIRDRMALWFNIGSGEPKEHQVSIIALGDWGATSLDVTRGYSSETAAKRGRKGEKP